MDHPVFVQNGQQHVDVASQSWYMRCKLQCHATAMLDCCADCSQPEWERHVTQQRRCPNKGTSQKKVNICSGHGCLWQEYMSVSAIVHIAPCQGTVCDTGQDFKVLSETCRAELFMKVCSGSSLLEHTCIQWCPVKDHKDMLA